jgi:hypothetical protein
MSCDGFFARCTVDARDWDPFIAIGDGESLIGFQLNDPGEVFAEEHKDVGIAGERVRHDRATGQSIPFPGIGDSVEVRLDFILQQDASSLTIAVQGNNVSAAYTAAQKITTQVPLSLVLLRDNDLGEQYQVNSISISTPLTAVPEPSTFALVGLGALALGWAARRRHYILTRHTIVNGLQDREFRPINQFEPNQACRSKA